MDGTSGPSSAVPRCPMRVVGRTGQSVGGGSFPYRGAISCAAHGYWLRPLAALMGSSGMALGALGAHAWHTQLVQRDRVQHWRTAVLYQLLHAVAVLGVAALCEGYPMAAAGGNASNNNSNNNPDSCKSCGAGKGRGPPLTLALAGYCMGLGAIMFSAPTYLLSFDMPASRKKMLTGITPSGGMLMIAGWILLAMPGCSFRGHCGYRMYKDPKS